MRNYRTIKLDLWQNELPPALNSEQNRKLIAEYQKSGDIEIRNKIIEGNLHFVAYYVIYFCKKYISKITQVEPDLDDLCQVGVLGLMKAIDLYNPNLTYTFNTYAGPTIHNQIKNYLKTKSKFITTSLDQPPSEEVDESSDYYDIVPEFLDTEDRTVLLLDYKLIKEEILPLINKTYADIFYAHAVEGKTLREIGEQYNYTHQRIAQIYKLAKEQILEIYHHGKGQRGVIGQEFAGVHAQRRYDINQGYIKKYGKDFLENCFMYKLPPRQAEVLKSAVLEYRGQSIKSIADDLGLTAQQVFNSLTAIYDTLDDKGAKFLKEYQEKE